MIAQTLILNTIANYLTLFLSGRNEQKNRADILNPQHRLVRSALILTASTAALIMLLSLAAAPAGQSGHNCENNIDQWETSTAALNVTPCVADTDSIQLVSGSRYYVQLANLTWKGGSQEIDIAFKFEQPMPNSGLDLWQNVTRTINNVTEVNVTEKNWGNGTSERLSNYTSSQYQVITEEWVNKNSLISHAEHNGYHYYFVTNIPVVNKKLLQARMLFAKSDVPPKTTLKWGLFGKLSSDSITTALIADRYSELDPLLNATSFGDEFDNGNDINQTRTTGSAVNGVFVPINASIWDAWNDQEYQENPQWVNTTPATTGTIGAVKFAQTGGSYAFSTSTTCAASDFSCFSFRADNVSVQQNEIGTMIAANLQVNSIFYPGAGIRINWDGIGASDVQPFSSASGDSLLCLGGADAVLYILQYNDGAGTVKANPALSLSADVWYNFTFNFNSSHAKCTMGTGLNKADTGWVAHDLSNLASGKPIFMAQTAGAGVRTFNISNFSVSNTSSPRTFSNVTLESRVLNNTENINAVILNLSFYQQPSNFAVPTCQVFDKDHKNTQNVTVQTETTLSTAITGIGYNCSFQLNKETAPFALDQVNLSWRMSNTLPNTPIFDSPANNSFWNVSQLTFNVTGTDADGDDLTVYWYLDDDFNTTTPGNLTLAAIRNGNHTMRAAFYDGTAFGSNSTTLNFTVDTAAPAISFIANTPANNSFLPTSHIFINTTANDAGSDHNDYSAFVDFNNSLVGYWRFEDDGDTNATDFSSYGNNGSMVGFGCTAADCNLTGGAGGVASGFVSSGKRGKAMAFDGVDDRVNFSSDPTISNYTIDLWAKFGSLTNSALYNDFFNTPGNSIQWVGLSTLYGGSTNTVKCGIRSGNSVATVIDTGFTPEINIWYHIAMVLNQTVWNVSTIMQCYVNGNMTQRTGMGGSSAGSGNQQVLGMMNNVYFNGTIDEVKAWKRILSQEEINASFNAGVYRLERNFTGLTDGNYSYRAFVVDAAGNINGTLSQNFTIDTQSPIIDNGSNSINTSRFINFNHAMLNYTYTENRNDTAYIRNGSRGIVTNTSPIMNTTYFRFNFTGLDDANYTFSAWMNDTSGNVNTTSNISITVDTTPPNITLSTVNSDANNTFLNRNFLQLNFSIAETYGVNFTGRLVNAGTETATFNVTLNTTPSSNKLNLTGLSDGRYNLTVTAEDAAGNRNTTGNYTFTIDTAAPFAENFTVTPTSLVAGNPFTIRADVSEANTDKVTATIAGINYTMTLETGQTYAYAYSTTPGVFGDYLITKIYVNDTSGNQAMNDTDLSVTATEPGQSGGGGGSSGGGGGGGGGSMLIIGENGTTIIAVVGNFTAKPSEIDTYDAYYPNNDGATVWSYKITANSPVKSCVTTNKFFCEIGGVVRTEVKISRQYSHNSAAQSYEGKVSLVSDKDNVFTIPVKVTSINFGLTLPLNLPLPSKLTALVTPVFARKTTDGHAQPRLWTLLALLAAPSIKGGMLLRRKKVQKADD